MLPNDSFNRIADTSTSGTPLATHSIGGKEYPTVLIADDSGHIQQTLPTYSWWVPPAAVGASKLYADIYNSSASTSIVEIRGVWAIPKSDVAVTGVVGIEVGLYRTNAIGTTGVNHVYSSGAAATAHVITPYDTANSSTFFGTTGISARAVPAGGATISALYWAQYIFTEETNAATYVGAYTNLLPVGIMTQRPTLRPGQGLLIKQGTVAGVGSMAFLGQFTVI
jgi:hypothetical protein